MPVAAVHEDRDSPAGIRDVGTAGSPLPIEAVAAEARFPQRTTEPQLRTRVARAIGAHDAADGRARRRGIGELETRHVPAWTA